MLIEKFAKRVINIQQKLNSFIESPEIELLLITSLKHQNKINESIKVAEELLKRDIGKEIKARVYYEIGIGNQNLGKDNMAKKNFKMSFKSAPNNVWGKLSKDYLDMF